MRAASIMFALAGLAYSDLPGQQIRPVTRAGDGLYANERIPGRDDLSPRDWRLTAATDAYQVLERLKPLWLRSRTTALGQELPVVLYVNGTRWGTAEALRGIKVPDLLRIRHISGIRATEQFGRGHEAGALLVDTR
jgi:hypothetical protein